MSLKDRVKKLEQEESTSSLSASQNLSLADRLRKLDKSSEGIKAPKTNGLNYNLSAYDDEDYQKKYEGASYEDVQRGLLKSTSNRERNYLKNYSDWSSTKDFDKAIENADTTKVKPEINADDSLWTKATKKLSRGTSEADILKSKKKAFQKANPLEKYSDIMSNADFEEKSKYNPNAVADNDGNFFDDLTNKRMLSLYRQINTGEKPSSFDMFYDSITNPDGAVEGAMLDNYKYNVGQMTDDEKKVYNYIYATQGGEAAYEFVKDISYATSKRSYEEWSEITKDMVNNSGPLANLALEGISAAGKMIMAPQLIANVAEAALDYDNYNSYEGFGGVNFVLSDVAPNIAEKYAEKYPNATVNVPLMGEINAPKAVSESITSDIEARVGQSLLGPAYTISMGMNSYLQSIRDAQEKGLPASQAVATAMIAGGVEIITESFGFENFLNLTKNPAGKQVALNVMKGVFNEGSEEVAADVLNTIADLTINGAQSEINQNVEAYKKAGMSDSEAWAKAKSDFSAQVAESFIAGGLSGGASTAVTNIINRANYSQLGENVDATRLKNAAEQAKASAEANGTTSDAYDYYAKLANKYGEDLSKKGSDKNAMTGYLLDQLVNEASSNYEEGAIEQFLTESGYSADVARETAKAIKAVNPTKEQEKVLKGKAAKEALAALKNGVAVNKANDKMVQAVADTRAAQSALKTRTERNIESDYKVGTAGTAEVVGTADNGKIRVIENGQEKTVDKKAVTVTKNTALALEYSKNLNENAQKAIIENMPASVENVQQYVSDAYHAFTYGQEFTTDDNGVEVSGIEAMKQDIKDGMLTTDIDTLTKLYEAGAQIKNQQKQQVAVLEQADQAVASAYQGGKQGSFKTDGNINVRTLSPSERALYYMAKTFTLRGQNVVVFKDASDKSENGKFVAGPNGGTVYINLAARYAVNGDRFDRSYVVSAFAHETTHWMKANAQEDFKVFADHIRNAIGQKQFDSLVVTEMNRHKQSTGNTLSEADAREEVIARACEDMLNNPDTYADIMSKATPEEQSNLKRIIMKAIDAVMEFLNTMLKNYRSNAEAARYLRRNIDEYEKLRQEWIAVFDKASTNVQAMLDKAVDQAIEPTEDIKVHNNDKVNMSATVEGVAGKLMAAHNMTSEELYNTVTKMGGFPMPSIAIKQAALGHNDFGDVSVIFTKDTIDPMVSAMNHIFSADAYTPTFPKIDYKIKESVRKSIEDRITKLVGGDEIINAFRKGSLFNTEFMEDRLSSFNGKLADSYSYNEVIKYAYLQDIGQGFEIPMREEVITSKFDNEALRYIADKMGKDTVKEMAEGFSDYFRENPDTVEKLKNVANEAYDAYMRRKKGADYEKAKESLASRPEVWKKLTMAYDDFYFGDYDRLVSALDKIVNGRVATVVDTAEFNNKLDKVFESVDENAYNAWLEDLFAGIIEKEGIYNNKPYMTASGNRRTWEAMHYEVTLENVVKVMKQLEDTGSEGTFAANNIFGVAVKSYKSIEEMRKEVGRLAHQNEEERDAIRSELSDRLSKICQDIYNKRADNSFIAMDEAAEAICDAIRHAKTVAGIDRRIRQWGLEIKPDTAQKVFDLFNDIQQMPTDYFEAKPKRAVGLNEIAYVVIPTDSTDKLREALADNGIRYVEYEHSDDNFDDRIKVTNEEAVRQQAEGSQVLFNSKVDSDGNELSAGQVEYFKDSKIRDANGNLLVVYHGTPDKSFNVFRGNEIYFTANKAYAQNYTHTYATGGKTVNNDNPGMFMGYLNIRKPFDINDSEVRNIFINEYVKGGYSQSLHPLTPIAEINRTIDRDGISWEEGGNLQEFLEESEYGYDGMVLNEGGYMTDKGPVSRGVSYVAFNSNQFKNIDNLNPTDNEDVRYNKKIADFTQEEEERYHKLITSRLKHLERHFYHDFLYDEVVNDKNMLDHYKKYELNPKIVELRSKNGRTAREKAVISALNSMHTKMLDWVIYRKELNDEEFRMRIVKAEFKNPELYDYRMEMAKSDAEFFSDMVYNEYSELREIVASYIENEEPDELDSAGKPLSKAQTAFYSKSKARNSSGRLIRFYHGTSTFGFTVFDPNKSDDSRSFFFSDSEDVARTYSGSENIYNPYEYVKIDSFEALQDYFNKLNKDVEDKWNVYKDGDLYGISSDELEVAYENERIDKLFDEWADVNLWGGSLSYKGGQMEVYLNLENPLIVNGYERSWNDLGYTPKLKAGERYYNLVAIWHLDINTQTADVTIVKNADDKLVTKRMTLEEIGKTFGNEMKDEVIYKLATAGNKDTVVKKSDFVVDKSGRTRNATLKYTREVAEYAYNNGYDGVIFKGIYDMGQYSYDEELSTVAVAFNSNQIKSIYNDNPTKDSDVRFNNKIELTEADAGNINTLINALKETNSSDLYTASYELKKGMLSNSNGVKAYIKKYMTDEFNRIRTSPSGSKEKSIKKILNRLDLKISELAMAEAITNNMNLAETIATSGRTDLSDNDKYRIELLQYTSRIIVKNYPNDIDELEASLLSAMGKSSNAVAKDSNGNKLTEAQEEYFKLSKVRDDNERLLVLYHGTQDAGFTVFDPKMSDDKLALFFTDQERIARTYANNSIEEFNPYEPSKDNDATYEVYVNLENPLTIDANGDWWNWIRYDANESNTDKTFYYEISVNDFDGKTYAVSQRDSDYTYSSRRMNISEIGKQYGRVIMNQVASEGVFENTEITIDKEGNYSKQSHMTTREIAQYAYYKGYDGVIIKNLVDIGSAVGEADESTIVIAFNSNQVKSIHNENPTNDADIRYNEKVNTEAYEILEENKRFEKENAKLKKDMARLKKLLRLQGKVTDGKVLDDHQLEVVAGVLLKDGRSNYSKDKLVEDLRDVYTFALDVFQSGPEAYDELMARLYDVAAKIMNDSRPVKVTNDYYKMVLDDIRKSRIRLSDEQIQEAKNEYGDRYRDAYWGRMTLANDGMPIESLWQEWADAYPDIFKADVNPNDMILELSEIYDSLKDASELKQYYTDTESIRSMANEVYEKFWNIKPIVTVADKYNEEIKKINAEHRQEMAELKESMQNQKLADRMYYSRVINKLKEQNAEKIRALKEYQRNKAEKYKDAARRKMAIEKITGQSTKLMSWMTENSRKHHINDALKVPVMNMLDAINFSSKQLLGMYGTDEKKFTPTRKDVSLAKAMQEIRVLVTNVVNAQGDDSKDVNVGGFLYFPPQMVEEITQLTDQLNDIERDLGRQNQYVLQEMTIEELESLQDIVDKMYHCVTKMNQLMADRGKALVAVPSQDTIRECGEQAVRDKANKLTKAEDFMTFKNGVPYYVFERLGKGASHILNNVFKGWGQFAFNIQKIVDFADKAYTQAEVKEWTKEVHDITVWQSPTEEEKASGIEATERQIKMTTAQMMSLYCLSKREHARQHMFGGGIRIADFKQDMNEILQTDAVTLTESEIDRIIGILTDRQREVADEIQQFMNTTCSAWGNDVTLQMYGTREFLEENYFPIKSDANVLRADVRDDAKSIYALLNMSFTKGLVKNANNQIVVDDIFNVFAVHASDMAKYNALALPVLDMIKWWNYSESVKREGTNFDKITVKGAIEKAYGKEANSYIRHLLEDINGSQESGRYDDLTSKFFKGYKVAAVGFNMQTVLLQPLSYIRANNVMDTKYLLAGLVGKPMTEKAKKYSGLAVWKSLGYYDTNVSFGLDKMITHNYNAQEIIADKSLALAGKADELTWGCLWRACEAEILSTRNLVYDTEEFNKAVAERFNEVIVSTQVMDSTVTRSDLMRSNATHVKEFTAFMSEPTLSLNVLQSNVIKFADETRKSNVHTAMQKYGRKIGKACAVYAFSALAESILRGVIGKLRDADWDEEDEETIMSRIWDNFLSELNIFNKIPVISNIVEILKGFSTQSMAFTGLDNTIKAFKKLLKSFEDGLTYKDVYKMIRGLSELKGIPLGNLVRTLKTVYDNTIGLMFKFGND